VGFEDVTVAEARA